MEKSEYATMYHAEDSYWWYIALKTTVFALIEKFHHILPFSLLLDAGCGTGGILEQASGFNSFGFDIAQEAIEFCKIGNLQNILRASV